MYHYRYLIFLALHLLIYPCLAGTLIPKTARWKFKSDGADQGMVWSAASFNDSVWASGKAELGFGDSPTTTLQAGYITSYFRKSFNIVNPSRFSDFTVNLRRDDGIIVYVNGVEVYRNNMPGGTVDYITPASSVCADDGSTVFSFNLPTSTFVAGNNVIAAEVHNVTASNVDLTFELELISNPKLVPVITRGPYLQSVNSGSAVLRWRTDIPSNSKVRWGKTMTYGKNVTDTNLVTEHQLQLNNLTADTKYFYTIGTTTRLLQGDSANFLRTAPLTTTVKKVRIWALGDFGNGSADQQTVLNSYLNYLGSEQNDMWIWLGDNAYENGTDSEYQNYVFNVYGNLFKSWNFYPALGNHDYGQVGYLSSAALGTNFPYFNMFTLPASAQSGGVASGTEKYYSYNWSNIHFIALDSYGALNHIGSDMYNWLQNDLASNTQRWTIVYFHHPPYSKGTHNSDTEIEMVDMRQNIVPLLETYGVDLVLTGHSHTYERSYFIHGHYGNESSFNSSMIVQSGDGISSPYLKDSLHNGTIYAVCGVGGKNSTSTTSGYPHNAKISSFAGFGGSLAIEIFGDTLNYKFLKMDGTIPDQFTMIKSATPRFSSIEVDKKELVIYPNPTGNSIHVFSEMSGQAEMSIFNGKGELVLKDQIFEDKIIDVSDFTSGVYMVKLTGNGKSVSQKLVINK